MSDPLRNKFFPQLGVTVYVYSRTGEPQRRSKNLAAILVHARRHPVNVVAVRHLASGNYGVAFYFDGGDYAFTTWADWRVLLDWLLARRSWSVERVTFGSEMDDVVAPIPDPKIVALRSTGTVVTVHAYSDAR